LIDPITGVPNLDALRRDIGLAGGLAGLASDRSVLVGVTLVGLTEIGTTQGLEAANTVLRSLIELAPFSLRGRDRVYRIAFDELAFLMTNTFEEGARVALERFAEECERVLAARALPNIRLSSGHLDVVLLAEAV
jgi:GGDEF domain-containing protein